MLAVGGCGEEFDDQLQCEQGMLDCNGSADDGCEVDGASDRDHCGSCGAPCSLGQACDGGACVQTVCTGANEVPELLRLQGDIHLDNVTSVPPDAQAFVSLIEPGTSDGDDSYVTSIDDTDTWRARFAHEPLELPSGHAITRVSIRARARQTEQASGRVQVGMHFASWQAAYGDPDWYSDYMDLTTSYQIHDRVYEEQPRAQSPWQPSEVAELELALVGSFSADPLGQVRATQLWLEVCHAPE
jgi:hypothetical protein